ncbi:MAG TPA: HU family DNA-binding protein [Armatimonadetes bacterium]|nr:HU family DNA-binding protein [Armatimonadota bacterium]
MTKQDLVNAVAEKAGLTKKAAAAAVNAVTEAITEALKAGERVTLIGFGSFEVRKRAKRTGVNPQTGEKMTIPATKVPAFRAGKRLKDAVGGK